MEKKRGVKHESEEVFLTDDVLVDRYYDSKMFNKKGDGINEKGDAEKEERKK